MPPLEFHFISIGFKLLFTVTVAKDSMFGGQEAAFVFEPLEKAGIHMDAGIAIVHSKFKPMGGLTASVIFHW